MKSDIKFTLGHLGQISQSGYEKKHDDVFVLLNGLMCVPIWIEILHML